MSLFIVNISVAVGGARNNEEIMSGDPSCYFTAECPLSNETCLQNCQRRGLTGSCHGHQCCCQTNLL